MNINHRDDIDGLRAIAILSVLIFHVFPNSFPGGFVGVDIFFVISGYLITKIIIEDISFKRFNFLNFYSRRVRRIFPALIVVIFFTFFFSIHFFLPDELKALGSEIFYSCLFFANFYFLSITNYFDTISLTKPLLHLWSLGIEEQYYVFWPLICFTILSLKKSIKNFFIFLSILILCVSFVLFLYISSYNSASAFYLPQSRIWELMIGSVLAYLDFFNKNTLPLSKNLSNIASVFGLFLLLVGFFAINDKNFFGWHALMPTFGTFFIIASGENAKVNKLLSFRVFVYFGLISYSVYLWHWPLISLTYIVPFYVNENLLKCLVIFLSIFMASLTYRFIEKPFRKKDSEKTKILALIFIMMCLVFLGVALEKDYFYKNQSKNNLFLYNISQLGFHTSATEECKKISGAYSATFCEIFGNKKNIRIAVLGDSTIVMFGRGLAKFMQVKNQGAGVILLGGPDCAPARGIMGYGSYPNMHPEEDQCYKTMEEAYRYILSNHNIRYVVFVMLPPALISWNIPGFSTNSIPLKFHRSLELINHDIAELKKHGKEVIVNYDSVKFPKDPRKCIDRLGIGRKAASDCIFIKSELIDFNYEGYFESAFDKRSDICIFYQKSIFIKDSFYSMTDKSGKLLLCDDHYLSSYGADKVSQLFFRSKCIADNKEY